MGAEAERNRQQQTQTIGASAPVVANGKVSSEAAVEAKISMGLDAALKPVGGAAAAGKVPNSERGLTDDEITATLAAASEKLRAAQRREQKKKGKKGVAGFFISLYPKKFFGRFRDMFINSCMMAAEKGDFVDLVAGHHAYYGETLMSRNVSQRRDREHEEMLNASLSRQVSISLSRQMSQNTQAQSGPLMMTRNTSNAIAGLSRNESTGMPGLSRNLSTGIPGLHRQTSTGIAGLNRQPSSGITGFNRHSRNTFGRSMSSKKKVESNLFAAGRDSFLQELATDPSSLQTGSEKVHRKH